MKALKNILKPAAWLFYLVIGIEIVYMISPFALYYYSLYGPSLNFLHEQPATAWLSGFFLPHYVKTSSLVLNTYDTLGWVLVLAGLAFFLVGAAHIYYHKFTRKGAVTSGLYKFVRHPQYVAFAVMGFGLLLAWPRFTVLIIYVTMLFVYYWLAKYEEKECEQKFGESYRQYQQQTSMFLVDKLSLFRKLPGLPPSGLSRIAGFALVYTGVLGTALLLAFWLRDYSISQLAVVYSDNSVTIGADTIAEKRLQKALEIARQNPEVRSHLAQATNGGAEIYLNYVVPATWHLPDVPMEETPKGIHGHYQPDDYDRSLYKVLLTRARTFSSEPLAAEAIIKQTCGREPLVLAYVDLEAGVVTNVETPPDHVRWGDIPTPLF